MYYYLKHINFHKNILLKCRKNLIFLTTFLINFIENSYLSSSVYAIRLLKYQYVY